MPRFSPPSIAALGTALVFALAAPAAWAQAFCSSDGQAAPVALVERFLSADCESCWSSTPVDSAAANELALDWIVPSARGDDAPLSAAASRDSATRLAALGLEAPSTIESRRHAIAAPRAGGKLRQPLRVAHGLPFNDYLGASLTLDWPRSAQRQTPPQAWLVLIETIPAGADGTPVERNLVRNVVQQPWTVRDIGSKSGKPRLREARSMSIPASANAERLRIVGFVEDAQGRILAAAQSRCVQTP